MDYDIDEIVSNMDFTSGSLVYCGNGLMLTNREIDVLKKYNIEYSKCSSLKEILYEVEEIINDGDGDDIDDLDYISSSIAERDYYQNTNK